MKKAQINYYLINKLRKPNKFFADNQFDKNIIKKKNKFKLSANAILNKFFKEAVIFNIISLAKIREFMARVNSTTYYNNHHSVVNNIINISKLV